MMFTLEDFFIAGFVVMVILNLVFAKKTSGKPSNFDNRRHISHRQDFQDFVKRVKRKSAGI